MRDVDFIAYEGKQGKILDASLSATDGRMMVCRTCEPSGINRPSWAHTTSERMCEHVIQALLTCEDVCAIDTGASALDNDCAMAVPMTRRVRACATVAVRPLEEVEPDRMYAGLVAITYRTPGWQSDNSKVLELDVLPRFMVNRLEVRASLLYYLTAKWLPRLSEPLPCESRHNFQTVSDWKVILKALDKGMTVNDLTSARQTKTFLSLYSLDQRGICFDCAKFDPTDDVPEV